MDFTVANGTADSLALLRQARTMRAYAQNTAKPAQPEAAPLPVISDRLPANLNARQTGTQLVDESREDLAEGGFRRTRRYENEDGRSFTRVEEFTLTDRGSQRSVIQQNPSGSITRYEEVLDRQDNGAFRRTQRFQDETGAVAAQITPDYPVTDPFILTRGQSAQTYGTPSSPFANPRGTQLDLRA